MKTSEADQNQSHCKYHPKDVLKSYVEGQAGLGYTEFDPGPRSSDVILATYPKSGSTWISYLLHQIRSGGDEEFTDIKNEVIDITPGHWEPSINPFEIRQRFIPRTYKTHGSYRLCPKGGRYLYVSRNPVDVLWSLYLFVHDLFGLEEKVPIDWFYREYFINRFDTDHDIGNIWDHLLGWYPNMLDDNLLWLHYEDLLVDRTTCINAIASFMEVNLDADLQRLIEEHSKMEYVRDLSSKLNPSKTNRTGRLTLQFGPETNSYAQRMKFGKIREGKTGGGSKNLPAEILLELDAEWRKRITPVLGYSNYQELYETRSLLKH